MTAWLRRAAALALGLGVSWLLLELLLRLAAGAAAPPVRSVALHESHGQTVSVPHRRHEPGARYNKPQFKIVVIGDSFTWGSGVYHVDTYGQRLETLLERFDRKLDYEVEMVSRPGWNTFQENRVVRKYVKRIDPDLFVLGYCLNDSEPVRQALHADIRANLKRRQPQRALSRFLHGRSHLYRLLWERIENTRQRRAHDHYYHELYRRPGWETGRKALGELKALADRWGAPFVAVIFPVFDQQLDAGYSYRDLHHIVGEELGRLGVPTLDLLPAYEGVDAVRLAVDPFLDPHPNELAHRIASQALAHFLISGGFVPIAPEKLELIDLSLPH